MARRSSFIAFLELLSLFPFLAKKESKKEGGGIQQAKMPTMPFPKSVAGLKIPLARPLISPSRFAKFARIVGGI